MNLYGGIEAGGTKFNCIIATGPDDIRAEIRIPTTTPKETLSEVIEFFQDFQQSKGVRISSIGIACFGPADLHEESKTWGYITSTPKAGWADTNIAGPVSEALGVPVAFDIDVNGAGLGEYAWGNGRGLSSFIYVTIGTGIGAGIIIDGKPVHGLVHAEVGHIRIPHDWKVDSFPGGCPFHGDCFEGLANGPAIKARWGKPAEELQPDHPAWDLEATYIALACHNLVCSYSPERIILGGGVMSQEQLFPKIRKKLVQLLNGYVQSPAIIDHTDRYITPPGLGSRAGELGAIFMAKNLKE